MRELLKYSNARVFLMTAKGALWMPAEDEAAAKSPAKPEIYVVTFLHRSG